MDVVDDDLAALGADGSMLLGRAAANFVLCGVEQGNVAGIMVEKESQYVPTQVLRYRMNCSTSCWPAEPATPLSKVACSIRSRRR